MMHDASPLFLGKKSLFGGYLGLGSTGGGAEIEQDKPSRSIICERERKKIFFNCVTSSQGLKDKYNFEFGGLGVGGGGTSLETSEVHCGWMILLSY